MKLQRVTLALLRPFIGVAFVLFLSFGQAVQALELTPEQYPFPTKDPYIATVLSSFSPSSVEFQEWELVYRPERLKLNVPLQKPSVKLQVYQQPKEAPLALIIAGLGGNGLSSNSSALGDIYSKAGYHVITLPSNLSWSYTMAISQTAAPGYMPRDSVEYYNFVKWVLDLAKTKRAMKISSIVLVGYSNGGLVAGFLAPLDKKQSNPIFKKVLLINPAIDVIFGIQQLDYMNDVVGGEISGGFKSYIMGTILANASDIKDATDPVKALLDMLEEKQIQQNHIQWVIGDTYRQSLTEIVLASHFIVNRGILKSPYSKFKLNAITKEARALNYLDYMNKVVIPTIPEVDFRRDITYETSLYSQMASLRTDSRVFLFTNTDDFLVKPEDLATLRETFGARLFLFPFGGHMGNIMVPFNVQMYLKVSQ